MKGNSVLNDVMKKNGMSVVDVARAIYGSDEPKNVDAIKAILEYNEVSPKKVAQAVRAAGGTEDEVLMAKLIVSNNEFKESKKALDEDAQTELKEVIKNFWAEFDAHKYTPFYEGMYNKGAKLLAEYRSKEAEANKKAKAATTKVEPEPKAEADADTTAKEAVEVEDPFDN